LNVYYGQLRPEAYEKLNVVNGRGSMFFLLRERGAWDNKKQHVRWASF